MSFLETCSKCVLFLSYVLLWVASGVLLFVGSKALTLVDTYQKVSSESQLKVIGAALVVSGVLLFVVGLLGFFACLKRSRLLLVILYLLMIVILFCEIGAIFLAIFHWSTIGRLFDKILGVEMDTYGTDKTSTADVDHIQSMLRCCGIQHYSDWNSTTFFHKNNSYPASCFEGSSKFARQTYLQKINTDLPILFQRGCSGVLRELFHSNFTLIIAVALVFFLLQIMGLHSSCIVICHSSPSHSTISDAGDYARL